jgi:hypothetical protein
LGLPSQRPQEQRHSAQSGARSTEPAGRAGAPGPERETGVRRGHARVGGQQFTRTHAAAGNNITRVAVPLSGAPARGGAWTGAAPEGSAQTESHNGTREHTHINSKQQVSTQHNTQQRSNWALTIVAWLSAVPVPLSTSSCLSSVFRSSEIYSAPFNSCLSPSCIPCVGSAAALRLVPTAAAATAKDVCAGIANHNHKGHLPNMFGPRGAGEEERGGKQQEQAIQVCVLPGEEKRNDK